MKYLKTLLNPERRKIFFKCLWIYTLSQINKDYSYHRLIFRQTRLGRFKKHMENCKTFIIDSIDSFKYRNIYNNSLYFDGSRQYILSHSHVRFFYNNDYAFVPDEWWLDYYLKFFGLKIVDRKYGRYSVLYHVSRNE